jgi:hypothetical protein
MYRIWYSPSAAVAGIARVISRRSEAPLSSVKGGSVTTTRHVLGVSRIVQTARWDADIFCTTKPDERVCPGTPSTTVSAVERTVIFGERACTSEVHAARMPKSTRGLQVERRPVEERVRFTAAH